jgi:tetratricopeptide (TPR) repeat protein
MPGEVEPLVAAGVMCNRLANFKEAVKLLEQASAIEPSHEAAYTHRIESFSRLNDHENAETTFYLSQQALEEPSAMCLAAMAESLIAREEYERAGWCLREALRIDPNMPRLRARLAAVFAATDQPQRALQMYLRDLRDDPGNIDTLLDYGELLMSLQRLAEAAEKFRRVLELEPANIDAHYRLGEIALAEGRFQQAHVEFELVQKLDAEYPDIRLSLAEALLPMGHREAATNLLKQELRVVAAAKQPPIPDSTLAKFGRLLLDAGLPADAAKLLKRVVAKQGESPAILRQLALARFMSGDRDGGIVASRRVLRLEPNCVASMHNLALAALETGRVRIAYGWIVRGLRVNRHDEGLRRLRLRVWTRATGLIVLGWFRLARGLLVRPMPVKNTAAAKRSQTKV